MRLTFLTPLLVTSFAALHADELRFAGTLGNSDDSQYLSCAQDGFA